MRLHVAYMFVVQDNDLEEFVMQGEFDLDDVDGLEEKTDEESDKPCCSDIAALPSDIAITFLFRCTTA